MKNLTYWKNREIEHAKSMLKEEKAITREIAKSYRQAARNIENEVSGLLESYADSEGLTLAQAKKRVKQIDIRDYEDKAKKYVKEKNFSKKANKEMKRYNLKMRVSRLEMIMSHVDLELIALADETDKVIYDRLLSVGENEVKRQAGILAVEIPVSKKTIEYIATRKFHNNDFSSRIWKNKRLLHKELKNTLTEQIVKGENPRKAARRFRQKVESSVYNSERLLRSESGRVQIEVQKQSYEEMEIEQFMFISTEDAVVCDICGPMDGKVFDVKDMQVGTNAPILHPNCRCSTSAYVDREAFEKDLEER